MDRRLTTIVAADIAGFSRLVGADEEGTLATQRAHRAGLIEPLLEEHGGRIANTAGDSLLIEFPSAVEAVRWSVAVQAGLAERNSAIPEAQRILYRIGINVGDVVTDGDDLLGDGVNIAARLEALAPPGGIVVSRAVRDQVRDRLDLTLADLGEVEVKNIARPVRAFQVLQDGEAPARPPRKGLARWPVLAAAAALVLIAALAGLFLTGGGPGAGDTADLAFPLPDRPSAVVLPFENLSGDPDQQYFVEGFENAIRTLLAKFPQLFVISGSTSGKLVGGDISLPDIRRELAVAYAVRGAVRRGGGNLTVDAELVDTATSRTVWAEQYDMPEARIFELQADLTNRIVGSLHAAIEKQAIARVIRRPETGLEAYNLYLLAEARDKKPGAEARREAVRLLQKAIGLEPDFLDAHLMLSSVYLRFWRFGGTDDPDEALRLARHHANRALEIDRTDYRVHFRLGMLHLFGDHRHDLAYDAMSRAIRDNPNDAEMLYNMGFLRSLMGNGAEGLEWNNKAKRVNPRYPGWYDFNAAMCHRLIGDYAAAIRLARSAIASYPKAPPPRRILIAALVESGRMDEARAEAEAFLKIHPDFRLSTYRNTPFQHKEDQDRYRDAMRRAGLPD